MIYEVYWRGADRRRNKGFIKARSRDEAYSFTTKMIEREYKERVQVTAVYEASPLQITENSRCLNFSRG